jgi:hypothetical protein
MAHNDALHHVSPTFEFPHIFFSWWLFLHDGIVKAMKTFIFGLCIALSQKDILYVTTFSQPTHTLVVDVCLV